MLVHYIFFYLETLSGVIVLLIFLSIVSTLNPTKLECAQKVDGVSAEVFFYSKVALQLLLMNKKLVR